MILSDLRSRVASNVGGRTDKNTVIDAILNFVLDDLARKYRWGDLEDVDSSLTLATGQYEVTLPTTVRLVEFVRFKDASGNWFDPDPKTRKQMRDEYPETVPETSSVPTACYSQGRKLRFSHLADRDLTLYLDVVKYATTMTASDEPCILGVDNLLVTLGTAHLYMHLKQPDAAQVWFALAEAFMESQIDEVIGSPIGLVEG